MIGFDAAFDTTRFLPRFKDKIQFVGRYYAPSLNNPKVLKPDEAKALCAAGISIVSVYEYTDKLETFDVAHAARDASMALVCADRAEQPLGTAIYFAVDLDVKPKDITARIVPYFSTIATALHDRYKVGVYGSGAVCAALLGANLAQYAWLGGAMGWTGSRAYNGWHIKQGLPADPYGFGADVDPNEARGEDYGQWFVGSAPKSAETASVDVIDIPDAIELQRALQAAGYYSGALDGIFGPKSAKALQDYYRAS